MAYPKTVVPGPSWLARRGPSVGDGEVSQPVQEDRDPHRGTPDPQGHDLRKHNPDRRPLGRCEGDDETCQAEERYDGCRIGRILRLG